MSATGVTGSRRWRLAALAAMAACAWPSAAAPAQAEARFTNYEAAVSLDVAWHFWRSLEPAIFKRPGYRCTASQVELVWLASLGSDMASANIWGCRDRPPEIRLEEPTIRNLTDVGACGVITHEYGHLLGYEHVSNQEKLMSGDPSAGERPPAKATWERAWNRCQRRL